MIQLDHVYFSYQEDKEVLKDISLTIEKGEFVALIGHNGSGKSTLAKLLNGLLIPKSGTVTVNGMDTKNPEEVFQIREMAGMIFQNPDNQIVASIVEEDVAFGPENLGVEPKEIRRRVDRALEEVGMSEYVTRPPHMLSGGQKQRIAIAGVLAMNPEIIIFDEATSMLDPHGRREMIEILKELHQKGITIVLITHFMEEAMEADRIYVMSEGVVDRVGTAKVIFSDPEHLKKLNLDIPDVIQLKLLLEERGIHVGDVFSMEDLGAVLCQLKSRA
ncbi:energy-coupling factor transporter ATPase [Guggenheimella bovis]